MPTGHPPSLGRLLSRPDLCVVSAIIIPAGRGCLAFIFAFPFAAFPSPSLHLLSPSIVLGSRTPTWCCRWMLVLAVNPPLALDPDP